MKKYIVIKADTNDADYVTEISEITNEQIEIIKPVIEAVKDFDGYHNFTTDERGDAWNEYYKNEVDEPPFNLFSTFIPHPEYGIHTIESIDIFTVIEEQKLL